MSTINYLAKIKEAVLYLNTADKNDEKYQRIKECAQKYKKIFELYNIDIQTFYEICFDERDADVDPACLYMYLDSLYKKGSSDIKQINYQYLYESDDKVFYETIRNKLIERGDLYKFINRDNLKYGFDNGYYIPVYPTAEEEAEGLRPSFIAEGAFLDLLKSNITNAFDDNQHNIEWGLYKIENTVKNSQALFDICRKIDKEDYALPHTIIDALITQDNDLLVDTINDLLAEGKHIKLKHYFGHNNSNGMGFVDPQMVPHQYSDSNEMMFTWEQYNNYNRGYKSYEEFLLNWADSKEQVDWRHDQETQDETSDDAGLDYYYDYETECGYTYD